MQEFSLHKIHLNIVWFLFYFTVVYLYYIRIVAIT